jgi:hypothetical protein
VKALGPRLQKTIEGRRQHMLPGVLLHVVEAAGPVDAAGDACPLLEMPVDEVQDRAGVRVHYLDDASGAKHAEVERLPA